MNVAALWIAALSAALFAVSTSLQHHANAAVSDELGAAGALRVLLRRPRWVLGQAMALAAFTLHSWALHLGVLVLVQPVVVSGIVLAVPVRAALSRQRPSAGEVATVSLTAAGLALFLVAADPRPSQEAAPTAAIVMTAVGAAVAAATAVWAGRRRGVRRATGFGFAAGVLFGVTGGLVKLAAADGARGTGFTGHVLSLITAWPAWAVVVVGLSGVALNQRAYRAGPLSASMPLLNMVDVLVAVTFGVLVFGEVPAHSPVALVAQIAAIALMATGLRRLARDETAEQAVEQAAARVSAR